MLLYTEIISNRLQYIVNFIAKETGIGDIELTRDSEKFISFSGSKINYSKERISEIEYWIKPHALLFENNIQQQHIRCFELNDNKAFFKSEGDFSFDIFAASFYLLSRYEEYLPHGKDLYGRYAHENSLAFNEGFLNIPLINQWLQLFKRSLMKKFPSLTIKFPPFTFLPTYDIDEAYSYKHKELGRNIGAILKGLIKGEFKRLSLRRKVLNGIVRDPYDAYEWMDNIHTQYNLNPKYFFLVSEKTGKYDRNILPKEKELIALLKQHSGIYSIGIHPSWQSGDDTSLLKKEIQTVQTISEKEIISSRQHYIRFELPETFRHLINAGVKDDYSMGYGSINGFRASVASSFYWYDLEKEEQTDLLIASLLLHGC